MSLESFSFTRDDYFSLNWFVLSLSCREHEMFHEQVSAISQWFTEWTEAEQMVLLYSLLKRLSTLQVKFLSRVVDQHLTDCAELQMLEQQANNPGKRLKDTF